MVGLFYWHCQYLLKVLLTTLVSCETEIYVHKAGDVSATASAYNAIQFDAVFAVICVSCLRILRRSRRLRRLRRVASLSKSFHVANDVPRPNVE